MPGTDRASRLPVKPAMTNSQARPTPAVIAGLKAWTPKK